MSKGILYLTQSKHRIWYYQRWISKRFLKDSSDSGKLFKVSLRTKNKNQAIRLSRKISVKIDELALQYFDNSDAFSDAMKLLYEVTYKNISFNEYEELGLDERDDWLLGKAESFNTRIQEEFKRLSDEILLLKEIIKKTKNGSNLSDAKSLEDFAEKLSKKINPVISDEVNLFLSDYVNEWTEDNQHLVATTLQNTYLPAIELFVRFLKDFEGEDIRINSISSQHIIQYQKFYKNIPKGIQVSKHSIAELVNLKGQKKLAKTVRDNFSSISSFLNWGRKKGYAIDGNISLILTQGSNVKITKKDKKQRSVLTDDDLKNFFNSGKYQNSGQFTTSAMYWVPLLSLFTGARMSELLQLEICDIENVEGIWCININDDEVKSSDEHKRLKAEGSERLVPIHKQLLTLGFIDFVKTRKERLFADEERNSKGKFDKFQKRQATYRKQVGVVPAHRMELRDFHSFRHTVRTKLAELRTTGKVSERFDEGLIDAIVGHESKGRSEGEKTYNHTQYVQAKNKAINRLKYGVINFRKMLRWDKCSFEREQYRK